MRRTYKSKKDTGGGLDHRDVLQNADEKSSAFDAFYIQNIKQTKRELSCMGSSNHYGVASNKVRKRKYVKRVIKEVKPPPRESMTDSVFLTPDKSIHVNRVPDLFDQLLNSSPASSEPKQMKKEGLFDKLLHVTPKESKTYGRKKRTVKKFNYSSNESLESNKENSKQNENSTQNATDIRSHELVIETEATPSPRIDESIYNIVKKLSLIKNKPTSVKKTFRMNNNRLTSHLQEISKSSPLSSTPCNEKIRSKSIYKFSPIPIGNLEESPNYATLIDDENDIDKSIVFIPKTSNNALKRSREEQRSRILNTASNHSEHKGSILLFSSDADTSEERVKDKLPAECLLSSSDVQTSSLQISTMEPFLGFSNETVAKVNEELKRVIDKDDNNSIILTTAKFLHNSHQSKGSNKSHLSIDENNRSSHQFQQCTEEQNFKSAINVSELETVEYTTLIQPFLGFTQIVENCDTEENQYSHNSTTNTSTNADNCENTSFESQDEDRKSFYDTCYSETSLDKESSTKEARVKIEGMNESLFQKYYNKLALEKDKNEENLSELSDDYASFDDSDDVSLKEDETSSQNSNINAEDSSSQKTNSSENRESLSSLNDSKSIEEERCVSFVTTRRRNDFTNNSTILVLDDSEDSISSADFDKTVLSRNKIRSNNNVTNDVNNDSLERNQIEEQKNDTLVDEKEDKINLDHSITTQNLAQSTHKNINISSEREVKPTIVLQPGKKWERSLSIYRRMTMINDHFDQSLLEGEDLHTKGRKYRQSVISTMEMQDYKGSLHNESIYSRRSTFVSKPSRSTIRIVKDTTKSRLSLSSTAVFEDLKGFLEDCDDTIIELSKLSIADDQDVTVLEKFHESTRIATAQDYVLRRCNQAETLLFDECYPDTVLKNCRKIGEGVYGEVYLWRAPDGRARVMKIVPIAGHTKVNGEHQKDFHEIISEIVIAMELSALRAPIPEIECHLDEGKDIEALDLHAVENATDVFNEVLAVRCVYGSYPSRLLDLWELYDECKGSENDNPAILPLDQQYIVLELANAGQDLESYQFNSADQAHALFLQVAFALAVGEEAFQFEHRDLHWGNVLIAPTDQKYATFVIRGRAHRVCRRGVAATIIDYSLSRVTLPLAAERDTRDCAALYNDLAADDGLFGALGDYQFEVYRLMRDKLGNDWKSFEPYTNILWLHYTVDKMITALRYKKTNTKTHKQFIAKLKGIKERILNYGSAAQFVLTDNEY